MGRPLRSAGRQVPVLGTERFRNGLNRKVRQLSREHPRHERASVRPSVGQVLPCVARAHGVQAAALRTGRRGTTGEARKVAMYLVKRACDLTLADIGERFHVSSYGVVSWVCQQVRDRLRMDRRFARRIAGIERRYSQQKTPSF